MGNGAERLPISLVIPAYRAAGYVETAIASARSQHAVPAEIIVVDDASPDQTGAVAAAAGAQVIRLAQNSGPARARNVGVAVAKQPWVAFLDADDRWLDGKLATQWDALCRWPDAAFCFTDYDAVYADGHIVHGEATRDPGYALLDVAERAGAAVRVEGPSFARGLVRSMFLRQSSAIVNRARFERSGGYDEGLRVAEDHDLFLRLCGLGPAVAIERALVSYCRQPYSLSADPLAEIASIDRLWTHVLHRPERYPAGVVELIRRRRPATLQMGARRALRLGRFAEAAPFACKALTFERSAQTLVLLALARALDNPAGTVAFRLTRSIWRARPSRTATAL